jgi:hypothetical protein
MQPQQRVTGGAAIAAQSRSSARDASAADTTAATAAAAAGGRKPVQRCAVAPFQRPQRQCVVNMSKMLQFHNVGMKYNNEVK